MADLTLSEIASPDQRGRMALHGTAVSVEGQGVLLFGPSGAGKSHVALDLMAMGARLISDDRVCVAEGPVLVAPAGAIAAIEARGVGLLHADLVGQPVAFALAVSLAEAEPDRLPPSRQLDCVSAKVPLILAAGHPNLASVIMQLLRKGRFR